MTDLHNSSKIPWNALNDSLQLKFNNKNILILLNILMKKP